MNTKPVMKSEIGIYGIYPHSNSILFYATNAALVDLYEFGEISNAKTEQCFGYPEALLRLEIDVRYDIQEIATYMENYGKDV